MDLKTRFQDCKSFEQFRQAFNSFALDQSLVNYLRCEKLPEESRFLINNGTPLSSLWINFLRKNLRGISSQHLLTGKTGIECLGDFISKLESQDKDRTLNAYLKTGIYRNNILYFNGQPVGKGVFYDVLPSEGNEVTISGSDERILKSH